MDLKSELTEKERSFMPACYKPAAPQAVDSQTRTRIRGPVWGSLKATNTWTAQPA